MYPQAHKLGLPRLGAPREHVASEGWGGGSTGGRGRNRHGFPPRATLTVACSSRQRLSAPCIRMGFCLPLASHCAVLTAPNSWAIPSSLAFDGEEGCTAVSHATVVGGKSRNAGEPTRQHVTGSGARRSVLWLSQSAVIPYPGNRISCNVIYPISAAPASSDLPG